MVDSEGVRHRRGFVTRQQPKQNRLVKTLTSKVTVSIELIKLVLLFVICVVAGLLLVARSRNAPPTVSPYPADTGEVVPIVPSQPASVSTAHVVHWEYKMVRWDTTYVEDCQATIYQWNELKEVNGGTGIGRVSFDQCYCGDPLEVCNAEIGSDVINPNIERDDALRFGLVPPPTPCSTCIPAEGRWGFAESKSSFVSTALKEGLTRNEIFTDCDYPTLTRTVKKYGRCYQKGDCGWADLTDEQYGASHYGFTPIEITVGVSLEVVEAEAVSCVLEKLVNRIAEDGWEFTDGGIDYQNFRRPKAR